MRNPRRPRSRPPARNSEQASPRDRGDAEFSEDIETRIRYYMASDSQELVLEPMNSYKRRLVHQIAKPYNLDTDSRGEEPGRHVVLIKSAQSSTPQGRRGPKLWDYGTQTLPVNPGEDGIRLALKMDGSVEIWQESQQHLVLNEREVHGRQIRIRKGKIVEPGDMDW
ncbi:MAG: hypothetical protein O7E56_04750 [SAR324 cluster bacterium]|nr:hypothetical protein [SAR324 cluster bacterium]